MAGDADKLDEYSFEVEVHPRTQKLIDELEKDLEPGEDWLHYDRDRLFEPPPAPPSEAQEHIVAAVPKPKRLRDAPTLDGEPIPFVPENARQARALRKRRLSTAAVLIVALVTLLGLAGAIWLAVRTPEPASAPHAPAPKLQPAAGSTAAATAIESAPTSTSTLPISTNPTAAKPAPKIEPHRRRKPVRTTTSAQPTASPSTSTTAAAMQPAPKPAPPTPPADSRWYKGD